MGSLAVWTNPSLVEQGATEDFGLDLELDLTPSEQERSNDFVMALPIGIRPQPNSAVFVDGTPWGGLVQGRASDTLVPGVLEWRGRTWLGVLADRVLEPPAGQAYRYASGTVSACIDALMSALGLSALFEAGECPSQSIPSYQFDRYATGMDALYGMLASVGLRPTFTPDRTGGTLKVMVGAGEIATASDAGDGDVVDVAMTRDFTPYNHIIALGTGELTERVVLHYYADASGNVSTTKTITGLAERTYKYDFPNAEAEDLAEYAPAKLAELQGQGSVDVKLPEDGGLHLGDYVKGYDPRIDESVTARVTKLVVNYENGIEQCAWSAE